MIFPLIPFPNLQEVEALSLLVRSLHHMPSTLQFLELLCSIKAWKCSSVILLWHNIKFQPRVLSSCFVSFSWTTEPNSFPVLLCPPYIQQNMVGTPTDSLVFSLSTTKERWLPLALMRMRRMRRMGDFGVPRQRILMWIWNGVSVLIHV